MVSVNAKMQAAEPGVSTWVSANAGSGKTLVLTDRVARLLLEDVSPEHILCLTYTKAAASEMQNRLFKRLGGWAMKPDAALRAELSTLGIAERRTKDKLRHARTLCCPRIRSPRRFATSNDPLVLCRFAAPIPVGSWGQPEL